MEDQVLFTHIKTTMGAEHLPSDYINQLLHLAANAHLCPLVTRTQDGFYQRMQLFSQSNFTIRA